MNLLRVWWARWRALFRRNAVVDEIREEMQFHVEMRADEYARQGTAADEARRLAARQFGNQAVLQDRGYDERGAPFWDGIRHDVRGAIRALRGAPAFTLTVVAVLALAIGASTAVYSIVDGVLLRPLPFDQPDRLVALLGTGGSRYEFLSRISSTTTQTFLDWRDRQHSFDAIAMEWSRSIDARTQAGVPEALPAEQVTADFFSVLRIAPQMGRFFDRGDEAPDQRVVVLSDRFWRREFGAAPDVVGRALRLNDETWQIVGVAPRRFDYPVGDPRPADVFVPQPIRPADAIRGRGQNYNGMVIGRLKPGVTRRQADADMRAIAQALDRQYPDWEPGRSVRVASLRDAIVGDARPWMLALLATIGFVLAIACANVTSLMIVRATTREREAAVRAALGAGRGRLMREAMIEGLVLAAVAAGIGAVIAWMAVAALRSWLPAGVPRAASIGVNGRVLAIEMLAACVVGVALGIAGASGAGGRLADALRAGGRGVAGRGGDRLRHALVLLEVAIATVLLVGAGLFAGSFTRLMRVDLGFDYGHVIAIRGMGLGFSRSGSGGPWVWDARQSAAAMQRRTLQYVARLQVAIATVPGVASVAAVDGGVPVLGTRSSRVVSLPDGRTIPDGSIDRSRVSSTFLSLLHVPILRGRDFDDDDARLAAPVAIVSDSTARQLWPGEDPIGQRLTVEDHEWRVVGVLAMSVATGRKRLRGSRSTCRSPTTGFRRRTSRSSSARWDDPTTCCPPSRPRSGRSIPISDSRRTCSHSISTSIA